MKNGFSTLLTVLITAVTVGVLTGVISYSYAVSKKDFEIEDLKDQLSQVKEQSLAEQGSMSLDTNGTNNQQPTTDDRQTTATPSTVTDETTDWKTYTNDKYGFSFKYPGDKLKENPNISELLNGKIVHLVWTNKPTSATKEEDIIYEGLYVIAYDNPNQLSAKELYKKDFSNSDYTAFGRLVTIGGQEGIQEKAGITGKYREDIQYISYGKKYYRIYSPTMEYMGEAGERWISKDDNKKIFDQILSTFQFTK